MWGIKVAQWLLQLSERERSLIEAQCRLEVLLSLCSILFVADKATGKYIQDHDLKADMLLQRALSQHRLMLGKGLPLDELRRKTLEEVHLKTVSGKRSHEGTLGAVFSWRTEGRRRRRQI
jgi:hypothetical protein